MAHLCLILQEKVDYLQTKWDSIDCTPTTKLHPRRTNELRRRWQNLAVKMATISGRTAASGGSACWAACKELTRESDSFVYQNDDDMISRARSCSCAVDSLKTFCDNATMISFNFSKAVSV